MATTTNFGWETPDDTDLVKDGAAAIRTALGGVDTSFVDLKGGTTGQVLAKASNTDLDYTWSNPSTGMTLLSTTALTGASVTVSSISTAYNDLKFVFEDTYSASDGVFLRLQFNSDAGNNYAWQNYSTADAQASGSGSTNASYVQVSKVRSSSTLASDGFVLLSNYTKSAGTATGISSFSYSDEHVISGGLMYQNSAAITSVTVAMSSGNITSGSLKIYGVK